MKQGDLVKVCRSFEDEALEQMHWGLIGTIVEPWEHQPDWWIILINNGELIHWPESQLEVINEN